MSIFVTKSSLPPLEEYVNEIQSIWETNWLTNNGSKHEKLESLLREYLEVKELTLFTNGHLGLEAVLRTMGLTGEVITTPYTFVSTTHAIINAGLQPVFCDIKSEDFTLDPSLIENLITDKTTAILPVHVYGNICAVDEIKEIAHKYNLKVIYDAAHAFGERLNDIAVGTFGDASMFSFHATKVFNTIEGGAVTTNCHNLRMKLDLYKNFGIAGPEEVKKIGINAKMSEFQAAMGICNIKYVNEQIQKRKIIAQRYLNNLQNIKGLRPWRKQEDVESNFAYFPIIFEDFKYSRNEVFDLLKSNEIHARKYFYPLTNNLECYGNKFDTNQTPKARYCAERVLTLPLYPDLSLSDVDKICEIIIQ